MEAEERSTLTAKAHKYETRARYGAWAVVVGLIVEILAVCLNNSESVTERISLGLANTLVALGVYAEIHFGRKSQETSEHRSTLLEKEAADARLRTAEIEALTAWRRVSPTQCQQIQAAIRQSAKGLNVLIETHNGDPEAFMYGREIAATFEELDVSEIRVGANSYFVPVFGVLFAAVPGINVEGIAAPFDGAGVNVEVATIDLARQFSHHDPVPDLYFFVAPKPPRRPEQIEPAA